ncbi:MAG: hypothetical protein ACUVRS_00865 [Armatimonadota bacterium]
MQHGLTTSTLALIWLTLVVLSFGQILIKLGVGNQKIPVSKNPLRTVYNIVRVMVRPQTVAGFSLYVVGTFIWLTVLSRVNLSVAFPMFSMSYFLVVFLSASILRERVDWRFALTGVVLISIGVTFVGLSSPAAGGKGKVPADARLAWCVKIVRCR